MKAVALTDRWSTKEQATNVANKLIETQRNP